MKKVKQALLSLLGLCLGFAVVFPVFYALMGAFRTPAEFAAQPPSLFPVSFGYLENFAEVWRRLPWGRYFLNSLAVGLIGAGVRMASAMLAAFAVTFYEFRGKRFVFFFILGTMMLPAEPLLVTNYQTVARMGLLDTWLGMAVTSFVGASQMFMLRQRFRDTPKAFREAATLDGCGDLRFLLLILTPLSAPVLYTLFVQSFVNIWNAYLWPLLVTNRGDMRTVQVGITMLTTYEDTNYWLVLAAVVITMIPAFILFLFLRRSFVRSNTADGIVS